MTQLAYPHARTQSGTTRASRSAPPPRPASVSDRLDPETASHCRRVAWYAGGFAERLGLSEWEVETVRLGALMHDVGKVVVPIGLLHKVDPLVPAERTRLQEHPLHGAQIAASMGLSEPVQRIVRHHHERWDGTGYPDGLVGEDIPRLARIVTIVDTYDALLTPRSYQAARSTREVLEILEHEAGRMFDPELLEHFLVLMVSGRVGAGTAVA